MKFGVNWTPFAAGVVAIGLLGAGFEGWLAAPLGALAAGSFALAARRAARTRHGRSDDQIAALQRALARRDDHLARTAHELRTPLASVTAALDLLRGDWVAPGREVDEVLAEAAYAARHLAGLVDDVLDAAALNAGRLRLQIAAHRVQPLLDDGLRLLRLHAERSGVRLEVAPVDAGLAVRTDARRFQQVVANLVGNAVKVAPRGSTVRLCAVEGGRRVRFVVADDGPGLTPAHRTQLFSPFAGGTETPGTGLGLFVSQRLVQRMGGNIGHGEPGHGAEFWFDLPRALPPRLHVASTAGAAR